MEVVAVHLAAQATGRTDLIEKDLFGRSAFNRFYYSVYLAVRQGLSEVVESFPQGHSDVPPFLMATVVKKLKDGSQRARRVNDDELVRMCSKAMTSAKDLAELLKVGYSIRVIADYYPEVAVQFAVGGDFDLNTVTASEARRWYPRAIAMVGTIRDALRQVQHA